MELFLGTVFTMPARRNGPVGGAFASRFACAGRGESRESSPVATPMPQTHPDRVAHVHRFEETIDGRRLAIEVALVQPRRWRAYLVRASGGPTALMPFYGPTPQEAARQLTDWLSLAHRGGADSV